ncbi:DNA-binding GntR family transcriptional regulator [Saccharopolyspora lacisalsi]|uniref:DNA-binding GntR family transcriptional regulator n=1 Tax=Halosaccharopolyspora lacisalsi TaxID=1000566 RepID=A0A839E325_9PSEU|nr:winged helix-turn-helix domain-containing protein [Halosaccharopolyspora lacisalsi]MBA8825318.1 DNA-binding GntR family transcriptional regulator [Halosaccharopolyspora lacisalsi]
MTSNDGQPKYKRVAAELREQITRGTLPVGAELPSTSRLMERFDVSVTVVRAAVKELRNEGLVVGQPGKGVYVRSEPAPEAPSSEYLEIKQQIDSLRTALDQAVGQLDQRLSRLESQARDEG